MKKYYSVTFKNPDGVYFANIAHAESVEAVKEYYSQCKFVRVKDCNADEVKAALRKRMAIVEVETPEK